MKLFKPRIFESKRKQRLDCELCEPGICDMLLEGADCDVLPGAQGEFGRNPHNPIPVNADIGLFKYFFRLRTEDGEALLFHQYCHVASDVTVMDVDAYEVVSMDGKMWDILYFDVMHPRRSNLAPDGYRFRPFRRDRMDLPMAFGIDTRCPDFPHALPDYIEGRLQSCSFAEFAEEKLREGHFSPNLDHLKKLEELEAISTGSKNADPKRKAVFFT